jgi:hypothetical protein
VSVSVDRCGQEEVLLAVCWHIITRFFIPLKSQEAEQKKQKLGYVFVGCHSLMVCRMESKPCWRRSVSHELVH